MRVTVPSPLLATHTEPAPTATPAGRAPDRDRRPSPTAVPGSIRTTAVVERVGDPHAALADRDPGRPVADRDRRQQPGRVHPRDVVGFGVGHPDRAVADRDRRPGSAFGSTLLDRPPVAASRRVSSPEDGATQTALPCAATAPGPARDDVADPHRASERVELGVDAADRHASSRVGSDARPPRRRRARRDARRRAARPGASAAFAASSGSMRETVWSSRFATHSDPEPNAIAAGRAPTATAPRHGSCAGRSPPASSAAPAP